MNRYKSAEELSPEDRERWMRLYEPIMSVLIMTTTRSRSSQTLGMCAESLIRRFRNPEYKEPDIGGWGRVFRALRGGD